MYFVSTSSSSGICSSCPPFRSWDMFLVPTFSSPAICFSCSPFRPWDMFFVPTFSFLGRLPRCPPLPSSAIPAFYWVYNIPVENYWLIEQYCVFIITRYELSHQSLRRRKSSRIFMKNSQKMPFWHEEFQSVGICSIYLFVFKKCILLCIPIRSPGTQNH